MELDLIIAEIKRRTAGKAVKLVFSEKKKAGPLDSKLGGLPYWDGEKAPYPTDSKGKAMPLLLQINFSQLNIKTPLPKKGMLQFFISNGKECECKVVYHEKVNPDFKLCEKIKTMPCGGFSPVLKECAVSFEELEDYVCVNDKDFDGVLKDAVKKVTGADIKGGIYDNCSDGECRKLCKTFTGGKSKLFGHPCIIQSDNRKKGEELLLQLDSDGKRIMWGDYGVGAFIIKTEALKKKDFSKVKYYRDCY